MTNSSSSIQSKMPILMNIAQNIDELFARAKNALGFLGLTAESEIANDLRKFLEYEVDSDSGLLETYVEYVEFIESTCRRVEYWQLEQQRKAAISKHVGVRGERMDFVARVVFTKTFPPRNESFGESYLTILNDDDGNVLKYWNHLNVPDIDLIKRPAVKGERVAFSAGIKNHEEWNGVPETLLQRVTKARIA